jgi:Mg-chelatase subunit ChlD
MVRRSWFPPVALLAALAGLAAISLSSWAAPAPEIRRPTVEVVFCLDTTGSMSGLIDGAKTKIWQICNQIINGKPAPALKVGLVAFRDKGDAYITKVYDLSDDLDAVYSEMRTYKAEGGGDEPESVNAALDDAVNKIKWSTDKKTLRIIFLVGDAPPHMDYPDDVKYPITCKKASERGIIINTIQCGNSAECMKYWKDICEKANGSFVQIPQAGGIVPIASPFDERLAKINVELARNTLVFGTAAKKEADNKKIKEASTLTPAAAADRVSYLAKEGLAATYDLLDTIRAGKIKLETLKEEELPDEMRKIPAPERREYLDRISKERARLIKEAVDLDRQRSAHLMKEVTRNKDSFDFQVLEILRKQANKKVRY